MQTLAIKLRGSRARPVIVATQMLASMMNAPRPTRTEVSDVAGAVFAGADTVMLSAETSVGTYRSRRWGQFSRIIVEAETYEASALSATCPGCRPPPAAQSLHAAAEVGAIVGAKALVAFTMTGETARRLARYRSPIPLMAFTTEPATRSQLALTWGVETFISPTVRHTDEMVHEVDSALVGLNPLRIGDTMTSWRAARPAARARPTRCGCTASATPSTCLIPDREEGSRWFLPANRKSLCNRRKRRPDPRGHRLMSWRAGYAAGGQERGYEHVAR